MSAQAIQIRSDFDVAIARNALRREIIEQRWKPVFRARAAAALTAMANLILFAHTESEIEICVVERDGRKGIQLACEFPWLDSRYVWLDSARSRLGRIVDEMEIRDTPQGPCITVWLLLTESEL